MSRRSRRGEGARIRQRRAIAEVWAPIVTVLKNLEKALYTISELNALRAEFSCSLRICAGLTMTLALNCVTSNQLD